MLEMTIAVTSRAITAKAPSTHTKTLEPAIWATCSWACTSGVATVTAIPSVSANSCRAAWTAAWSAPPSRLIRTYSA
ncbi:hypothetical protein ACFFX0_15930 [Citricoccus parietis]|uniref:Uncharacterized protein n=1 Tax=Citricoccus parietis TaxID=592307 RepID=A0ABV5G0Z8_9MICC